MNSRPLLVSLLTLSLLNLAHASPKPAASSLPGTAAYHRAHFEPGRTVHFNVSHVHTLLIDGHYCLIFYTYDARADVDGGTALAFVTPEQMRTYSAKYGTRRIRRRATAGQRDLGVTTQTLNAVLDRNTPDALYVRLP
ncbi:MAG: hypothetical protein OHK005_16890 [Candidatus Methylacidiphilales bacterium]